MAMAKTHEFLQFKLELAMLSTPLVFFLYEINVGKNDSELGPGMQLCYYICY